MLSPVAASDRVVAPPSRGLTSRTWWTASVWIMSTCTDPSTPSCVHRSTRRRAVGPKSSFRAGGDVAQVVEREGGRAARRAGPDQRHDSVVAARADDVDRTEPSADALLQDRVRRGVCGQVADEGGRVREELDAHAGRVPQRLCRQRVSDVPRGEADGVGVGRQGQRTAVEEWTVADVGGEKARHARSAAGSAAVRERFGEQRLPHAAQYTAVAASRPRT